MAEKQSAPASLARHLRKCFSGFRFRVSLKTIKDGFAHTWYKEETNTYIIEIDKSLPGNVQAFILIHEFAHVISWPIDCNEENHHSPNFYRALERVYPEYENWCNIATPR